MNSQELIRIIVLIIIGGLMIFLVQPLGYQNQWPLFSFDNYVSDWINNNYMLGAFIVFIFSVIATILWFVLTGRSNDVGDKAEVWRFRWWLIGILPILSIFAAIFFCSGKSGAVLSLTFFYLIDMLIIYWLTTASSTPGNYKYLPPLSMLIRKIIGD